MSRLRPRISFAAAFVNVVACGGSAPNVPDAEVDAVDCDEYPYEGNCNPPPPPADASVDAVPSGCIDVAEGCGECVVAPARAPDESPCVTTVCARDPVC